MAMFVVVNSPLLMFSLLLLVTITITITTATTVVEATTASSVSSLYQRRHQFELLLYYSSLIDKGGKTNTGSTAAAAPAPTVDDDHHVVDVNLKRILNDVSSIDSPMYGQHLSWEQLRVALQQNSSSSSSSSTSSSSSENVTQHSIQAALAKILKQPSDSGITVLVSSSSVTEVSPLSRVYSTSIVLMVAEGIINQAYPGDDGSSSSSITSFSHSTISNLLGAARQRLEKDYGLVILSLRPLHHHPSLISPSSSAFENKEESRRRSSRRRRTNNKKENKQVEEKEGFPYYASPRIIWETYNINFTSIPPVTEKTPMPPPPPPAAFVQMDGQYVDFFSTQSFCREFLDGNNKISSSGSCNITKTFGPSSGQWGYGEEATLDAQALLGITNSPKTHLPIISFSYHTNVIGINNSDPCAIYLLLIHNVTEVFRHTPDLAPSVLSISYGTNTGQCSPDIVAAVNRGFVQLGVLGVSVFVASGDDGSGYNTGGNGGKGGEGEFSLSFPATSPYVTSVGATRFVFGATTGSNTTTVVNETASTGFGSGGGFSADFLQESYQTPHVTSYLAAAASSSNSSNNNSFPLPPSSLFNSTHRGVPDMSAIGQDIPLIFMGMLGPVNGTSASAPIAAGMFALLNVALMNSDKKYFLHRRDGGDDHDDPFGKRRSTPPSPPPLRRLGFLNPMLYHPATAQAGVFRDIVTGDNCVASSSSSSTSPSSLSASSFVSRKSSRSGGDALSSSCNSQPFLPQPSRGEEKLRNRRGEGTSSSYYGWYCAPGWDPVTGLGRIDFGRALEFISTLPHFRKK